MYTASLSLLLISLSVSVSARVERCTNKEMKYHTVSSSSSLTDLARQPLHCAVITVLSDELTLTQILTFRNSFNLSLIGQPSLTEVSCEENVGFKFIDSKYIHLENFMYVGCSMNDTVRHLNYTHIDQTAVYIYNSSDIFVSNCYFFNNTATGLVFYEVVGDSVVLSTNFSNNKPEVEGEGEMLNWELSNLTYGGLIICRENGTEKATYTIQFCNFQENWNRGETLGGGMTVLLGASSTVRILTSYFIENMGGGLYLVQEYRYSSSIVDIKDTVFLSNNATGYGGGLRILNRAESDSGTFHLNLYNCEFDSNFAQFGGGLFGYGEPYKGRTIITAHGTNWTRNGARNSGFAVYLGETVPFGTEVRSIEFTCEDCWIFNNSLKNFADSGGSAVGAVYVLGSKVTFRGSTELSYNYGSALYLRKLARASFDNGEFYFSQNKATRGSAISLKSSAVISLSPSNTTITFIFNSAIVKGGAIYAELEDGDSCIFSFLGPDFRDKSINSTLWFIENYANNFEEKQSIYISGYYPKYCFNTTDNSTLLLSEPFHYDFKCNSTVLFDADRVRLAAYNGSVRVMLGESFYLQPVVTDRFNHSTTTFAYVSLTYDGAEDDDTSDEQKFKFVGPSLIGLDNYTENNALHIKGNQNISDYHNLRLQMFFDKNTGGYRDGYLEVKIDLTPCKLGFSYNSTSRICECFTKNALGNMFCPNSSTACVRNGYWFGQSPSGPSMFLCDNMLCNYTNQKCPTEVCPNAPGYCLLNNEDDLCYRGRAGTLCSKCQQNHSFTFSAYKCVPDNTCSTKNSALILLGVFLYWIFMISLFFIILSMNISVGTGFASGIVYYFSVIFVLTDSVITSPIITNFLSVSVSVTQVCARIFGAIPVCFLKSMDCNLHHELFHFCSPLVVVVTILAIVWFSHYCKCPKRLSLADNSPNHAICLLILTSYTSMTYSCFQILRPILINGRAYVYIDPDIPYFHPSKHLPYALVAIVFEVAVSLPICILLLLAPCLSRLKRVNLVRLRLKPIVDEYQACYKEEHRWFAGFYFLARQLMYFANSMPYQVLPQLNSLFHCICVIVLLTLTIIQPYKKQFWYLNMIDTLLLTDILLLSLLPINSYTSSAIVPGYINVIQTITPYVLIILPSLYLFGIILFLLWQHCRRVWKSFKKQKTHTETVVSIPSTMEVSEPEGELERDGDTFTDSFFRDQGEREPLLRDTDPVTSAGYSSVNNRGARVYRKQDSTCTTSSLRVSDLKIFPPAVGKATTR